jgi:hypothetical protein
MVVWFVRQFLGSLVGWLTHYLFGSLVVRW